MTYTCATEGCGESIYWDTYTPVARWRHERSDNLTCNVREIHYAHPAGGTNTTPPEELERDVKKVTMDYLAEEFMVATPLRVSAQQIWDHIEPLIQRYADQAVEEVTAELRDQLGMDKMSQDELTLLNRVRRERDDLREQLDQALVPRFKVGDRVKLIDGEVVVVLDVHACNLTRSEKDGGEYNYPDSVLSLAPLETECEHHPVRDLSAPGTYGSYEMYPFCPLCGESLTKEDA